jgi:hypothetical protein
MLLSLYLISIAVGIAVMFFRSRDPKNITATWKAVLIASCTFLPIGMNILVSLAFPVFVFRYLLYTMPYLTVLAAIGIVSLLYNERLKLSTVLTAVMLGAMVWISVVNDISFLNDYRKEDWRGAARLLRNECVTPEALRLYLTPGVEDDAKYYNERVGSQIENWVDFVKSDPTVDDVRAFLPAEYNRICLVQSHIPSRENQLTNNLHRAISEKYPNVTSRSYHGITVEIFDK